MRRFSPLLLLVFYSIGEKISVEENDAIQKESNRVKRVLYGEKLSKEDMKYVVAVQIGAGQLGRSYEKEGSKDPSVRCSGTIISPNHILTAGHCFYEKTLINKTKDFSKLFPKRKVFVHFGGNCLVVAASGNCSAEEVNRRIDAVYIPRIYGNTGCRQGDIAIVEVRQKFPADLGFGCLPNTTRNFTGRVFAAGYGSDPNYSGIPQKFKERAEFTAEKYCDFSLQAPKGSICTEEDKQFLCKGDSGSGIMQVIEGKPTIFGVLSIGTKCSEVKGYVDHPSERETARERCFAEPGRRFMGSINTDVRKYIRWVCGNTGVCIPGLDRKEKVNKKTITVL